MASIRDLMALRSLLKEVPLDSIEGASDSAGNLLRVAAGELDRMGGIAGVTAMVGEVMADPAPTVVYPAHLSTAHLLNGVPLTQGAADGRTRVVDDESGAAAIEPGEVLVAASLSPAWSTALERCGAVVVEAGAASSRPFAIARERGIPAVRLEAARERLASGLLVRVLGEAGTVEILTGRA
jgi:phosphohistidine swiveling domain-containing protein